MPMFIIKIFCATSISCEILIPMQYNIYFYVKFNVIINFIRIFVIDNFKTYTNATMHAHNMLSPLVLYM